MSQQPIANNADSPLMSSASAKNNSLPTKLKTVEEQPFPRLANDSLYQFIHYEDYD